MNTTESFTAKRSGTRQSIEKIGSGENWSWVRVEVLATDGAA